MVATTAKCTMVALAAASGLGSQHATHALPLGQGLAQCLPAGRSRGHGAIAEQVAQNMLRRPHPT